MSAGQPSHAELAAAIKSERAGVAALAEELAAERQALAAGETDRVADMAPRKRELLLHIAHMGEARNRMLERCGVSTDRKGMERLLATLAATDVLITEWRALIEITQRAHRLNQENGVFVDAGMRANQQALSVLTSAAAATGTYGASGRTLNPLSSRSLASA
jgi:flagella synthesis protein FlgN